jgi:hypothetical protein
VADQKITALTQLSIAGSQDLVPIVRDPSGSPVTQAITVKNLVGPAGVVTTSQVISAASADISGLSVSVSAGKIYDIEAQVMFNRSTTSVQSRWGIKFPAAKKCRGTIYVSMSATQGVPTVSSVGAIGVWNGDSASGSAIVAVPAAGSSITSLSAVAQYKGVLYASATGVVIIQAGATSANGFISIKPGSYLRVFKVN